MKQFIIHLLVLSALLAVVCPVLSVAEEPKGLIQGSILSAETNQPIAGASISFSRGTPRKPPVNLVTASDAAGKFMASLPAGTYRYTIRKEGFGLLEDTAVVDPAKPLNLPVPLNREAKITGRLVDSGGNPLQGIAVSLGKHARAVTDAKGKFSVAGLDAGWFELSITHTSLVLEKPVSLTVAAGELKDLGNCVLRKGGILIVRLVTAGKGQTRPVPRAEISLSGGLAYRNGRTDGDGKVLFKNLPPGSYTLEAYDERITDAKSNVEVPEGNRVETRLEASIRPPSISLDESGRVFLPDRDIPVSLRALWVDGVRLTVYSVDASRLLEGAIDPEKPDTIPALALKKIRIQPVTLKKGKRTLYRSASLTLKALPPGFYVVEADGVKVKARSALLVTRLGLVAKTSMTSTLVFAADLVDGTAQKDVDIFAIPVAPDAPVRSAGPGRTDPSGLFSLRGGGAGLRVIGRKGGNLAIMNLGGEQSEEKGKALKGYLYTERPAYRPGQTVYFKGVARKRIGEGYALPDLDKVRVVVTDSGDQTLVDREHPVSSTGSWHGEFTLPEQPSLGTYTIKAEGGGQSFQASFKVLEYRKPEFEVSAKAPQRFYVAGDPVQVSLRARYYFGAPVVDAKVKYRIYARPYYHFGDEGEAGGDGDEEESPSGGYADFLGEGEAVTDAAGTATIAITTQPSENPRNYTVEMDVADIGGREVSAAAGFTVTPSLIALSVRPLSYLASPGRPIDIAVTAGTYEGKPVRAKLAVSLEEEVFDKKTRISSYRKIDERQVATDESGRVVFSQVIPRPGYWKISATTLDERGLKAVGQGWIWVWRQGYAWDSSYRELGVELDKKSYRPGDTARLIVKSPAPGAALLLSVEGRELYRKRVIPLNGTVQVVDLPVTEDQAPYVFISAIVIDKGRFYSRTRTLKVDSQPDRIDLKLATDKEIYAPGDTVRLSVFATGSDARPREAELSLGVVDEAMYAVAPERKDDIYRFFRGTREHLVTTLNSFPQIYLGGASKAEAARFKEKELQGIKVRKVFKDTAYWLPVLKTGTDGRAGAEFALPDNLTTWRATAIGHDDRSEFGVGRGKFIARLDVMARLQPPRFLVSGDLVRTPGVITNMTDSERSVNGVFESEGVTRIGESRFGGTVAAGGTLRKDIEVKADAPGEALLRMRALAGDRGDAMELLIPVLPRGIKRVSQGNIVLRDTRGDTTVSLPENALDEKSNLSVTISPTLTASLNESLKELIDYPYGCVEQTMSRFLPAVYVRNLVGSDRWSLDRDTTEKLARVIDQGLGRLYDFQHEDGGWGWWKEDATDPSMTAHVMYGFSLARKAGVTVRDSSFDRGLKSLAGMLEKGSAEELPSLYRAYTLAGKTDDGIEKRIEKAWKQLQPSRRMQYIEALLAAGRKDKAGRLLAEARSQVKHEGSAAWLKDEDADSWWYSWRWSGSAVETTAMMLENQLRIDPKDPVVPSLAEFLVRKRTGRWWNTTRGTAAVITALANYAAATGEYDASYTASLTLNGRELERYVVNRGKVVQGRTDLSIPRSGVKRGGNQLVLSKDSPGGALYLAAHLDYFVPPEAAAQSGGLSIGRAVYRLKARQDGGQWRMEYLPLKPGDDLAPGEEVEVRLTVDNRQDMNFVIIEDRLPAGFEVREVRNDPRFSRLPSLWDWYAHQERHDERMAFFLDTLPAGRHEFRYLIYPELEGNVLALPASVWPMYVPSLRSESSPWKVRVIR